VPDRVDAPMEPIEPPGRDPSLDRGIVEPELVELSAAHDSVLPAGEPGEKLVWGCR
jgi:hypothetical protein